MPTESEKILFGLADQAFLPMWAFPNVYKKSGKNDGRNNEICDLLVVFGNDVLIFSDKCKPFKMGDDPKQSWDTWYRKAVMKSADQVFGAERILFDLSTEVYLDEKCEREIPVVLPKKEVARVHRILVARGATDASSNYWGDSGSLGLTKTPHSEPFFAHQPYPEKGCTHIIDSRVLEIVLQHLDTLPDFIDFLVAFEKYIFTKGDYFIPALEECLARFIETTAKLKHQFPTEMMNPEMDFILLEEGMWREFVRRPEYLVFRKEQVASRRWDDFLERAYYDNLEKGTAHSELEEVMRFFASRHRIERRVLTSIVEDMVIGSADSPDFFIRRNYIQVGEDNSEAITFLVVSNKLGDSQEEYLALRAKLLWIQSVRLFSVFPELEKIGGVAFNPLGEKLFSESFGLLCRDQISAEELEYANGEALALDIFQKPQLKRYSQPSFEPARAVYRSNPRTELDRRVNYKKIGRNGACVCGSGKKFKVCCWHKLMG